MRSVYEYIVIEETNRSKSGKTGIYTVYSRDNVLGVVRWFGRWRQYAFFPKSDTLYSRGCLRDIADFVESLR